MRQPMTEEHKQKLRDNLLKSRVAKSSASFTREFSNRNTITGYDFTKDKNLPVMKSIRLKCKECVCGSHRRIEECQITDCTLWPYRFGRRPKPADLVLRNSNNDYEKENEDND